MRKIFYDADANVDLSSSRKSKIAWPKKGHRLLKSPVASTPKEVSAHLDWLQTFNKSDLLMPDAYKQGGDYLIEALRLGGDGTHPDKFIFPVLYLYRHAIELRLKEIICLGLRLKLEQPSQKLDDILGDHPLYPLWNRARKILETYWPDGDRNELSAMESMISELHQTDSDGQHFRYAHAQDGTDLQLKLPEQLDLLHLRTVFNGLWNLLDGALSGLMDAATNIEIY